MEPLESTPRDRIMETASRLFYRYGFQAVGVDLIVEESGVAKMTLYRHFPSKDDLIVEYLRRSNDRFWRWFDEAEAAAPDAKGKLLAVFQALEKRACTAQCLGCTFQSTAAEFPDPGHAAHRIAVEHKESVRRRLRGLAEDAGLRNADAVANQLLMLMDGAWVAARMFERDTPARDVADAAAVLIEAQLYAQAIVGEAALRTKSVR